MTMTANEIYLAELRQEAIDHERAEQLMKSIAIPVRRKRPETVIYISTAPCDYRLRMFMAYNARGDIDDSIVPGRADSSTNAV